jgi:hypothetical protein
MIQIPDSTLVEEGFVEIDGPHDQKREICRHAFQVALVYVITTMPQTVTTCDDNSNTYEEWARTTTI